MGVLAASVDDEDDVVARVDKTSPAHAEGMRDLVGISTNVRQGEHVSAMRVDFELNCGTAVLMINGGDFVLSLRTCFVVLKLGNCEVHPRSRYEASLAPGSVEASSASTCERSDAGSVGGGFDASVQAAAGLVPKLGLSLTGGRNKKVSTTAQETFTRQARLDLVVSAGQDRWQVGDPRHGDARRSDGRLLGSYFGEVREANGDLKPLCRIAASDPASTSTVTVSAVVRFGQLLVHLGEDPVTADQREDVDAEMRARERKLALSQRKRERDLRGRMAGLVLAKAMHAVQSKGGVQVADGEVLIAQQTLVATPRRALKAR